NSRSCIVLLLYDKFDLWWCTSQLESKRVRSSAASDVYKRQLLYEAQLIRNQTIKLDLVEKLDKMNNLI
ncbi:hypothetical protein, partial [Acinetobacter sp. AR2-3]|uniref:hypothetical protein n=1 Tax=Acinetobacter sp. AR2-3 TaxID=1891969 RepID=UPI001BB46D59